MKITIAGFSFHGLHGEGKMDAFGYLESVKYRYHLDAADIWNGQLASIEEDYLCKVREGLDERELTLANYHADGCHVWEDDPEAREHNYRLALQHLRAAEILGAKTMRIDTGGTLQPATPQQMDALVTRYGEYAKRGADAGFRVGPENHWGLSLLTENMETLAHGVNSPHYGVLLHVGHWEQGGEEDGDRRISPWVMHTHLDARITATCLEPRIRLLRDSGYTGYWGVEHHSSKNEYYEVGWQLAEVRRALTRP